MNWVRWSMGDAALHGVRITFPPPRFCYRAVLSTMRPSDFLRRGRPFRLNTLSTDPVTAGASAVSPPRRPRGRARSLTWPRITRTARSAPTRTTSLKSDGSKMLNEMLGMIAGMGYVKMEEVPEVPRRPKAPIAGGLRPARRSAACAMSDCAWQ